MNKSTLTLEMIDALSTCNALDNAAYTLSIHDGANWAPWVHYFLEVLQHKAASPEAYEAFLQNLQRGITTRLEQGQW